MVDSRATLHTIVQGSTVDLFHSCGIAVAPVAEHAVRREPLPFHELSAAISFTGRNFTGELTLGIPQTVFTLNKTGERPMDPRDWVREITNQLCGRIKSRLLQFHLALQSGLPVSMTRETFDRHCRRGPFFSAYGFRTLRGEVLVTVAGDIRHEAVVYAGAAERADEGVIILF